jgi:hypothetical protein
VGVGFKRGESVLLNSPGLGFADGLQALIGEQLTFYDLLVSQEAIPWMIKVADDQWKKQYINDNFDAVGLCVK